MAKSGPHTLKHKCKEAGVDYWRALKRRQAGFSDDEIFEPGYMRSVRKVNEIAINGIVYPNLEEAIRSLNPVASATTINRWIKQGMSPEQAFCKTPNPGISSGCIYLITNKKNGKRYIGLSTFTPENRLASHAIQAIANYITGVESLHADIRRYGIDAFDIIQIDQGTTKEDLEEKEKMWIAKLGTRAPVGYNLNRGE